MRTMFIGVIEAAEILGTSESYAYKLIQKMNKQMRELETSCGKPMSPTYLKTIHAQLSMSSAIMT